MSDSVVPPYAGQNQTSVLAAIVYHAPEREQPPPEPPLVIPADQPFVRVVPPPLYKTELWAAQQTWPL